MMNQTIHSKPRRFRKQLLLPAEHGSWAWLLVPYFVGTAVAGSLNLAALPVLLAALALFLMRQPATIWLRIRQSRGRKSDEPLVARLTVGLALTAAACLVGLLWLGIWDILWLAVPVSLLLLAYVAIATRRQTATRTVWLELVGAVGLALTAPAAMIAASEHIYNGVWWLWLLMALQNSLGVFYVRLRLADTHRKPAARSPQLWAHLVGSGLVILLALSGRLPALTILPFLGFGLRALWLYLQPRPIANIKKFGFLEVGLEIISGLLIIAVYLI